METIIDNLDDKTGWTVDKASKPTGVIEIDEYETTDPNPRENLIAGGLSKSLFIKVEGDNGNFAQKTFTKDLTGFNEIIFHAKSIYEGKSNFKTIGDFLYKIDFGFQEYFLPNFKEFIFIRFKIPENQILTKIKITCLHDNSDVLMFSFMVAAKEEIPLDFLNGVKKIIEDELDENFSLGKLTGNVGDSQIDIVGDAFFVGRLSKIKIEGANPEEHNIKDEKIDGKFTLGKLLDGDKLKFNHIGDDIFLNFPVLIGTEQREVISPAIVLWNYDEEARPLTNAEGSFLDTYSVTDGTVSVEQEGFNQLLGIQIDCEAVSEPIMHILKKAVRKAIHKKNLWVNGQKFDLEIIGPPVRVEASDLNVIPKISYQIGIEFEESVWPSQTQNFPLVGTTIVTVGQRT